ncbi:hypothetical protein IDM40_26690 [Nocardiopsis sp. HNM0947]|uniref:Uncharacterized protein n=1 Tax=Nocardiopsis coralli TaxID=2772213 RepID=A0ABR9PEI0_9ACTN|nr:hypothetical protein [Nocardiopsis coralli]MBE3002260.1 hypothetical protein [Nocardiopsis coralli]
MTDSTTDSGGSRPSRKRIQYHRPGPDLAAAMTCDVCAEKGISNPPGWNPELRPPKKPAPPKEEISPRKRVLPINPDQYLLLQDVWERVIEDRAGTDPESRMLAVAIALRAVIRGFSYVLAHDMKILRIDNPEPSLSALTSTGWLDSTPERILAAGPMDPETCDMPSFHGNPWETTEGIRTRASGWYQRAINHRKMRKKPARLRVVGAYLASRAEFDATISVRADDIIEACALSGPMELVELLEWLVRIEWITQPNLAQDPVRVSLTEVTAHMAPTPYPPATPPRITPASTPLDRPVQERADALVLGREAEVAEWVGSFREVHGHGPSWTMICDEFGWPSRRAPDHDVTERVFYHLREYEWLVGFGAPFGLRPGPGPQGQG